MESLFSCPVCKESLFIEDRSYKCNNRHCFDMAKEGYVNLLVGSKSTEFSGDDKEMVAARTRFLDGGYYSPLREKMCSLLKKYTECKNLLDAGCGEGYYTSEYAKLFENTIGVDISKSAVKHASKRCKNARFAVGSVYHLPVCSGFCDAVVNCFSPNVPSEFHRVLKDGGYLFYVVPAPKHLWELKSILYDNPYENEEKTEQYDGFEYVGAEGVTNTFTLSSKEEIDALFHMTPYSWNTPKECAERLKSKDKLDVTAEFVIHIYRKV